MTSSEAPAYGQSEPGRQRATSPPFRRADLARAERQLLRDGRWANARVEVVRIDGQDWTLKDFSPRSWLVRAIIGPFLLRREHAALRRLQGLDGVSPESFRVDTLALAARFVPGETLAEANREEVPREFFERLEALMHAMHARGVVHLDVRGTKNILVRPDGTPGLIDFQSSQSTRWMPGFLRRILEESDLCGVYKRWSHWQPGSLDEARLAILARGNELRRYWPFSGYGGTRKREQPHERQGSHEVSGESNTLSVRSVFHHPGLRRWLVRLRVPLGIVALLLFARFARPDWLWAGMAVSLIGEFIQVWCFASLDKASTLAIRGPYSMVRNPMYLGRYFIVLGFVMLLGNWWVIAAFTVLYWLYMDARVEREERRLRPIFGEPYDRYCATVRRFVPGAPATGGEVGYWSWKLFRQNHAGQNLLATVGAWALLALAVHGKLPFVR